MIGQGIVLMISGMGIVYVFLSILIIVTRCTMGVVAKFDSILPQEAPKKAPAKPASASGDDADVALAIAVALNG